MNTLRKCCSYPYKQLGTTDSDERLDRRELVESDEFAVMIDNIVHSGSGDSDKVGDGRSALRPNANGGVENGGISEDHKVGGSGLWRQYSYDFFRDRSKGRGVKSDMESSSEYSNRSFDFRVRDGGDPPSKLIANFLDKQKLAGEFTLDMDAEMEELRSPRLGEQKQRGERAEALSSVPENCSTAMGATVRDSSSDSQSETNSPQEGASAARSSPRAPNPTSSISHKSSLNARSSSVSPRDFHVSFESEAGPKIAIGSPVYETRRRYGHSESEIDRRGEFSTVNLDRKSSNNIGFGNDASARRKSDENDDSVVLKCSSRVSSSRSNLMRVKTRSRLVDPPPPPPQMEIRLMDAIASESKRRSGQMRSGQQRRSGMLGKTGMLEKLEEEEDDPFLDDDFPDEFRQGKRSIMSILQWVSFFATLTAFVCSLSIRYLTERTVWGLHLWKWALLILVLLCGRLLSGWAIRIAVFFVERNFMLRKRVLYFVYGIRKAVQNCLWLGLVLLAWHFLFDHRVQRKSKSKSLPLYVTKVLVCLLVGTLIWLVKTLLVKVLASSFHVTAYFDRIQETLFSQFVLETLSGPPVLEIERSIQEEEKIMKEVERLKEAGANVPIDLRFSTRSSGRSSGVSPRSGMLRRSGAISKSQRSLTIRSGRRDDDREDDGITIDRLHKLNQTNVSAWNMKRLMRIVRHGALSTLDDSINNAAREDESAGQIRSEWEAKVAAKKIFKNVAKPGAKYIRLEDLMRFLREDEAMKAMAFFEGAQDSNRVTKSALKNWVVNVFRERRALALTLNDTKTAVNKLHQMVNVVLGIAIVIIWLLILGIATTHIVVLISSQLLLVVFVFGNTCKTVFESIIFLFVMHPFDVGDRCSVDDVQMVVEEMNILTTVFLRYDNLKISYPNSQLATKPICNFYRSPDMGDAVEFIIHISTPVEKVSIMKERITRIIENKQDHWYPNPTIVVKDIEDMNKMKIAVWIQHRMNHQDMGEKFVRRSHLIEEMIRIFRELDIEYRMLPLDVNLRQMPAMTLTGNRLPSTWMT